MLAVCIGQCMISPSALSQKYLLDLGYHVDVCERWVPKTHIRKDLFGFADLVAIHPKYPGVLAVQATTRTNLAARRSKTKEQRSYNLWLVCGNRIVLHGWYLDQPDEDEKKIWMLKEEWLPADAAKWLKDQRNIAD